MKFTKLFSFVLILMLLLSACSSNNTTAKSDEKEKKKESTFPEKPITLIVSFAAGGGTDLGARILAPYLEDELGVPVVVENKPGGGGWIGYADLIKAKPDGYTIGYLNTPGLITGYLNPTTQRQQNLDDFEYIASHVLDAGVIAVKADDNRFNTIEDLIEFAKKNNVTATTNGVASGNHIASLQLNDQIGTKFKPVHFDGTAESFTAVLGGHVDVLVAKVGEVVEPVQEGQMKVLAVMMEERVAQFPDVPTLKETVGDVVNYSSRGIGAPKGLDPEVLKTLQEAFEKAINNQEHIAKMEELGLNVDLLIGEDYKNMLQEEEKVVSDLKSVLGW
ncbi:tripartite tricarboxylate transporter substrate binding protein [Neobacillus piezotolerans]|uniref:Tripartite tricarboxylate transporter substrate binding protein n=1 Tax=Neobacillus piezotolerans TaxID=2259171 RepID=A0A3D8GUK7_9BACI|nr:tripartite tricarboxylate transporter substrate binding protein [Neobacillus piezotolerans]RDU38125.1 tripartite tricarboxylate transporter substrate binding protein [Neobacillus piezotolerans]